MTVQAQPEITIKQREEYRESYANSVQIRISVWDFLLEFGVARPAVNGIEIDNFQGVFLSPQQAKALSLMLQQNVNNYEQAFGEIKLDPQMAPGFDPDLAN